MDEERLRKANLQSQEDVVPYHYQSASNGMNVTISQYGSHEQRDETPAFVEGKFTNDEMCLQTW